MNEKTALHPALSISGASCQGCVRNIRSALEPLIGGANQVEVSLDQQTVALPEGIDTAEAARLVTDAGYPAKPLGNSSDMKPDQDSVEHDHSDQAHSDKDGHGDGKGDGDQITLTVSGATCASCVNTIEKALKSVKGITGAHMNLADNTATATGHADSQALIRAVESAGYGASVIEDPDAADDQKQADDRKRYRDLLVKMTVSLGLGIGLMAYGMGFGTMMVTEANQWTWINLGILTLAVMVTTGGHFYTGAWKDRKSVV